MTAGEFVAFRAEMIREYASEQVRAGSWGEEAEELAAKQTDDLLPDGAETPGMLVLAAENAAGAVVGRVWVALQWPGKIGAWICQIEVVAEQRGKGYGRALLRAAEEATAAEGVEAIGLNVFGRTRWPEASTRPLATRSPRCRCASSCAPVTRSPRRSRRVPGHEQA